MAQLLAMATVLVGPNKRGSHLLLLGVRVLDFFQIKEKDRDNLPDSPAPKTSFHGELGRGSTWIEPCQEIRLEADPMKLILVRVDEATHAVSTISNRLSFVLTLAIAYCPERIHKHQFGLASISSVIFLGVCRGTPGM